MAKLLAKIGVTAAATALALGAVASPASSFAWYKDKNFNYDNEYRDYFHGEEYGGYHSAYGFWDRASSWKNYDGCTSYAYNYSGSGNRYYLLWSQYNNSYSKWVGSADNDKADSYWKNC